MSIVSYVGLPGSGKSYGVVKHVIVPALEASRTVVTNIPMNQNVLKERYPSGTLIQFTWEEEKEKGKAWWDSLPPGCVLVMDELWRKWPAGVLSKDIPEHEKSWLAEHRHKVGQDGHSTEVVYVTQDLAQLAKFARSLIEKTFQVKKLTALGMDKSYVVNVYQGPVEGQTPPRGRLISTYHGKYEKATYELYQSHTQSETGIAGLEKVIDKRGTIWRSPAFKFGAIFIVVGGILAGWNLVSTVNSYGQDKPPAPVAVPGIPTAYASAPPLPDMVHPGPVLSQNWRLAGTYQLGSSGRALLQSTSGQAKTILLKECTTDGRDWECQLDGEKITKWTGQIKEKEMVESGFKIAGNSVRAAMK